MNSKAILKKGEDVGENISLCRPYQWRKKQLGRIACVAIESKGIRGVIVEYQSCGFREESTHKQFVFHILTWKNKESKQEDVMVDL
jgi:hypothetical protein